MWWICNVQQHEHQIQRISHSENEMGGSFIGQLLCSSAPTDKEVALCEEKMVPEKHQHFAVWNKEPLTRPQTNYSSMTTIYNHLYHPTLRRQIHHHKNWGAMRLLRSFGKPKCLHVAPTNKHTIEPVISVEPLSWTEAFPLSLIHMIEQQLYQEALWR